MKRKLLPLAIGAAIAMPGVALAGPTVYGKVNVSLESYDNDSYDQWEVNSNASRLGVKGKEKITDSLSAVYKAEFEMYVDDGEKNANQTFKQRNIFGGLKGGFGEVIVGKFDSPLKTSQKKVDLFNDYKLGDIKNVLAGENRTSNTIQYTTPDIGAFTAKVAIIPGEGECVAGSTGCDDGLADGVSASVAYEQDGVYVALAADSDVNSTDVIRLIAQADIAGVQAGLIYQEAKDANNSDVKQKGYVLSGALDVSKDGVIKLQYAYSEVDEIDNEITQIALGYDHKLSKQTKLFTHYISLEDENGTSSDDKSTIAFGLEHKF
ncbi:MAG: porin [Gammaproteobacteria bacterium]|nr:MAG: porin [Gammaproteobacteria bacterium]